MKQKTRGIWTCIKYKNEVVDPSLSETDPKKRRATIYLWVRDEDGKRIRLAIKGFKPYFYVLPVIESEANSILQMPEIESFELEDFGGKKLYKIYTYTPSSVPKVRNTIQALFSQVAVKEADVLYELRYLIDKGIRAELDWTDENNPIPCEHELNIPLRKLYIDIEIWSKRAVFNESMRKDEYIKCLSAFDSYERKYYTWYYNEYDLALESRGDWQIVWCRTIAEMLKNFFTFVKERDPDVITGYNIDFDLLNIRQEAVRNDLKKEFDYLSGLHDLGYTVAETKVKKHRIRGVDWSRKGIILDGREVIDMLDCVRLVARTQLRSYSLDYIAKVFLGEDGKITYNGMPIAQNIVKVWSIRPDVVLEYNKHDVELMVKLDEKHALIDLLDTLRKTVGVRLQDAFSSQRMIDTELLRRRKFPLPCKFSSKREGEIGYKGAFVITPTPGLHSWVVSLDYMSLYPSIIRTFNIDVDSYISDIRLLPPGKTYCQFSNADGTKTWRFLQEPRALLPQTLDDFTALRNSLKAKMKEEKDENKKKLFDTRQEVVKVLSNSVYGTLGYRSRKHNLEVAEAVTAFGQKMIQLAASIATELGMQVVAGDTDSVFVSTGTNNYGEAYNAGIQLQREIQKRIPKFLSQFGVATSNLFQIKLEKVYDKFFIATGKSGKAAKKRYCGREITKDGKTRFDIKGLDIRRSDSSLFATELQKRLLTILLEKKSKLALAKQIAEELNKIDSLPLEEIGVPSAVSKPLKSGYKLNPIQKRAALNSNTYLDTHFEYGSKPLRVYIKVPPLEKVFPKSKPKTEAEKKELEEKLKSLDVIAFDDTTKLKDWVVVDYQRILAKTVRPKIEGLLESLQLKWEDVEAYLKDELKSKKEKRKRAKETVTLDKFLVG